MLLQKALYRRHCAEGPIIAMLEYAVHVALLCCCTLPCYATITTHHDDDCCRAQVALLLPQRVVVHQHSVTRGLGEKESVGGDVSNIVTNADMQYNNADVLI